MAETKDKVDSGYAFTSSKGPEGRSPETPRISLIRVRYAWCLKTLSPWPFGTGECIHTIYQVFLICFLSVLGIYTIKKKTYFTWVCIPMYMTFLLPYSKGELWWEVFSALQSCQIVLVYMHIKCITVIRQDYSLLTKDTVLIKSIHHFLCFKL